MFNQQHIWESAQLPSLPGAAVRLLDLSKDPIINVNVVANTIKSDPALTVRILRASNSSFFAVRSQVTSIDRAVPLLGIGCVTSLALGFTLMDESMQSGPLAEHFQSFWAQSLVHATAAELLSAKHESTDNSEAFQAGLLVDLGQLAMLKTMRLEYLPVLVSADNWQREVTDIEQEMLGFDHAQIGARLAEAWSLPASLRSVIELHHASVDKIRDAEVASKDPLPGIVALAAAIGDYFCRRHKGLAFCRIYELCQAGGVISEAEVDSIIDSVRVRFERSAELFQVQCSELPPPSELMAEANAQLSELAVRAQMESAFAIQRQREIEVEKDNLESKTKELEREAFLDSLTHVYNRKFFDEALSKEIEQCRQAFASVAVIFIDLDGFKKLNDTHGHGLGDLVLSRVGQALKKVLRKSDIVARYGGEEFVILVKEPGDMDTLGCVAEKVRVAVESASVSSQNREIPVSGSLGAVLGKPGADIDDFAKHLVETADQAMYDSKRRGGNQVHIRSIAHAVDTSA